MAASIKKPAARAVRDMKTDRRDIVTIKIIGSSTTVKRNKAGAVASIEFVKSDDPPKVADVEHRTYSDQELCDAEDAEFFNSFLPKKVT